MQRRGRLLCPLQLPDKEHGLPAVDALQESRLSPCARTHAHAGTHTLQTLRASVCVPPPGQGEGVGRLSPGPLPDTPDVLPQPCLPAPPEALPADCPELVKGFDFL